MILTRGPQTQALRRAPATIFSTFSAGFYPEHHHGEQGLNRPPTSVRHVGGCTHLSLLKLSYTHFCLALHPRMSDYIPPLLSRPAPTCVRVDLFSLHPLPSKKWLGAPTYVHCPCCKLNSPSSHVCVKASQINAVTYQHRNCAQARACGRGRLQGSPRSRRRRPPVCRRQIDFCNGEKGGTQTCLPCGFGVLWGACTGTANSQPCGSRALEVDVSGRANTWGENEKGLKLNETAAGSVYLTSFSGPGRGWCRCACR